MCTHCVSEDMKRNGVKNDENSTIEKYFKCIKSVLRFAFMGNVKFITCLLTQLCILHQCFLENKQKCSLSLHSVTPIGHSVTVLCDPVYTQDKQVAQIKTRCLIAPLEVRTSTGSL